MLFVNMYLADEKASYYLYIMCEKKELFHFELCFHNRTVGFAEGTHVRQ